MPVTIALALASAAWLSAPGPSDEWVRVRTPHFEVLSDAGEAPARAAAGRLEGLRRFLLELFPDPGDTRRDVTVLVVGDPNRFGSLVPRARLDGSDLAGFFLGGSERDYAVLLLSPDVLHPFEAIEHEYAHLVLNGTMPAQPVWLAEGLAELLSGGLLDEGKAWLGGPRPEYAALLRRHGGGPLEDLLSVDYDSPEYLGRSRGALLYARSWALVRWVVHRHGLETLRVYAEAMAEGQDAHEAFATAIGDLREAESSLLQVPEDPVLRVDAAGIADPVVRVDAPTEPDVAQRIGEVLLHGDHAREALRQFERALAADPTHLPSRASLGGLLARQGKWGAARHELEAVLERRPDDPMALLQLARLRISEAMQEGVLLEPVVEARVVADLETALEAEPQLFEAALLLAQLRAEPREDLVRLLEPLFEQQPERTVVAQTLSQLYLQRGQLAAARRVLERGRDAAPDGASRYLCRHLLAQLEGFNAATVEVHGDLIYLDCRPDGSLRFTISADPSTVKLEAASTRSFVVHGTDDPDRQAELLCGYQDRPITVRYDPASSAPDVNGRVLWLVVGRSNDR